MRNSDLTEFEHAIIKNIYEYERPNEKIPELSVVLRERSGSGMYITLHTKKGSLDVSNNETLGKKLHIMVPQLPHGGGALLYLENGKPKLLEIYVNGYDDWPESVDVYSIEYRP